MNFHFTGGLSLSTQEASLRTRPDIIVATPGRLIDHLRNSQSIGLEDIEVLILDEADRLLDMGFTDEIEEIVKRCPVARQTMLFSATMTKKVMNLATISLKDPVYIAVNRQMSVANTLRQEFIRVKSNARDCDREAMLVALCKHIYKSKTIIFCASKRFVHHLNILFGLLGFNSAEIHGNLSQAQRLEALEQFRDQKVDFLIATDLASRGLDIVGIQTVINFHMPRTHAQYIHRVGRAGRAGKTGRACSFIAEPDRLVMKEIVRKSQANVGRRKIPPQTVDKYRERVMDLRSDIDTIIAQEGLERSLDVAQRDLEKINNINTHAAEILARPKRTWFQTNKEKLIAAKQSQIALFGDSSADANEELDPEEAMEELAAASGAQPAAPALSKRQQKKKLKQDEERKESQKRLVHRKKRRKLELEESNAPKISKAIKASKSSFKPKKFNEIDSFKPTNQKAKKSGRREFSVCFLSFETAPSCRFVTAPCT